MIGLSAGGEGLPCLTLNSPDCARHKTPSVSMSRGERRRGGERQSARDGGMEEEEEESEGVGWRGGQLVKSQVFMTSAQICVLTSAVIAASSVMS